MTKPKGLCVITYTPHMRTLLHLWTCGEDVDTTPNLHELVQQDPIITYRCCEKSRMKPMHTNGLVPIKWVTCIAHNGTVIMITAGKMGTWMVFPVSPKNLLRMGHMCKTWHMYPHQLNGHMKHHPGAHMYPHHHPWWCSLWRMWSVNLFWARMNLSIVKMNWIKPSSKNYGTWQLQFAIWYKRTSPLVVKMIFK